MTTEARINIKLIATDKNNFLDLLLLADESKSMIDRYLERGDLFALYDGGLKSVCVVTEEAPDICELKNIATYVEHHGKGYGSRLIRYICEFYKGRYAKMIVGTGDVPKAIRFYEKNGFEISHRIENFFTDNYDHQMFEDGVLLTDMVYLKRELREDIFKGIGLELECCKMEKKPDPTVTHPVPGFPVTYVKPTITRSNIEVGDFTYFSGEDFESRVTHHYEFYGDRLIIGKFCQIAPDVEFVMNGVNHKMDGASTFPFYILEGWNQETPPVTVMTNKGDTVIGNDVWIGQNATILPGVHIGDGAIIGASSVVGSNVAPYTVVAGNPAKPIRKRFDDELIQLLQAFRWWDKTVDEIQVLIPLLNDSDLEQVKRGIKKRL